MRIKVVNRMYENMSLEFLKSRTVLVFFSMFLLGGLQATEAFFTPEVFMLVTGILTVLGTFFRVNPKQEF